MKPPVFRKGFSPVTGQGGCRCRVTSASNRSQSNVQGAGSDQGERTVRLGSTPASGLPVNSPLIFEELAPGSVIPEGRRIGLGLSTRSVGPPAQRSHMKNQGRIPRLTEFRADPKQARLQPALRAGWVKGPVKHLRGPVVPWCRATASMAGSEQKRAWWGPSTRMRKVD